MQEILGLGGRLAQAYLGLGQAVGWPRRTGAAIASAVPAAGLEEKATSSRNIQVASKNSILFMTLQCAGWIITVPYPK